MSINIHTSHCSAYFLASIHIATMLSAVVKLSAQGTLLSVNYISIRAIATKSTKNTTVSLG